MEFLLEINVEEMPLSHVRTALADLSAGLGTALASQKIAVSSLRTLSTTRRLVLVGDFAPSQPDGEEVIAGPPKTAAYAADGSPTAAALGFARSKGVAVSDLKIVQTEKGEYVGVRKTVRGKATAEILSLSLPQVITSLSFPKMMRWGTGSLRFSRPIRRIVCLFGGRVVPFSLDGLASGEMTSGHKLHAGDPFRVVGFEDYRAALRERFVLIEPEERRASILNQVARLLAPVRAELYPDEDLLDKLVNDVEWPFVILGSFPKAYLDLPLEVLSTAMREGQKLFSVVRDGRPLPHFLGVADVVGDPKGFIRQGNERVLKARLEDARFFWEQDLKAPLKKHAAALKHVLFQEKLGSYADKAERLTKLVAYLCEKADARKAEKDLIAAAELCKADLVTGMVREFPALQGKVGGLYARREGLSPVVARAIAEHYGPLSVDDPSPESLEGALLSLADKLDSIVGVLGVGIQTTGSSDPFGLRRNAQGVCKIILEKRLSLSFGRLLDKAAAVYGGRLKLPKAEIVAYVREFFAGRLRTLFEREGFRYDLVNAALGAGTDNIYHSYLRVKALDGLKASPQFEPMILMAKRVTNILGGATRYPLNPGAFVEKAERDLYSTFAIVRDNAAPLAAKGDFDQAQRILFRLQAPLNVFFEKVLVMTEDTRLRRNRLALLQAIRKALARIADYSQVVVEGEKPARDRRS
jgi:glycyl-tRNA synthetase beta chain